MDTQVAQCKRLDGEFWKINKIISHCQRGIERLNEYRTALISAAVTGKIDVRSQAKELAPCP
jgi:hypothetical protein